MASKRSPASDMALGGVTAALAVVIMCMGGLIPVATFVCPMLCMMLLTVVMAKTGRRNAWVWFAAVALLSLLLGPDKEAAAVFAFLGYYPILKPKMDRLKGSLLWKLLFFNAVILALYWLLLNVFGLAELVQEFSEMGTVLTLVTLALGNFTFFLLDRLLDPAILRRRKRGK